MLKLLFLIIILPFYCVYTNPTTTLMPATTYHYDDSCKKVYGRRFRRCEITTTPTTTTLATTTTIIIDYCETLFGPCNCEYGNSICCESDQCSTTTTTTSIYIDCFPGYILNGNECVFPGCDSFDWDFWKYYDYEEYLNLITEYGCQSITQTTTVNYDTTLLPATTYHYDDSCKKVYGRRFRRCEITTTPTTTTLATTTTIIIDYCETLFGPCNCEYGNSICCESDQCSTTTTTTSIYIDCFPGYILNGNECVFPGCDSFDWDFWKYYDYEEYLNLITEYGCQSITQTTTVNYDTTLYKIRTETTTLATTKTIIIDTCQTLFGPCDCEYGNLICCSADQCVKKETETKMITQKESFFNNCGQGSRNGVCPGFLTYQYCSTTTVSAETTTVHNKCHKK